MESKILSVIERYQMLSSGATVIVAFSGGADSIALLSFLNSMKEQFNIKLMAAHVNHGIRGKESDSDEHFVKQYCEKLNVDLKILHADVPAVAKLTGESEEECGRRIRYEFFESIDKDAIIATAHTLSDSVETVLFNLTRGTALKGLCGIPPKRGNIIRPLIECKRSEIEEYCSKNKIAYVTDSTNNENIYSRNSIRHNVIPHLEKINPSFLDAVFRCVKCLNEDSDLLNSLSCILKDKIALKGDFDAELLKSEHPSIRKRVIADLTFENSGIHLEQKHIDAIDNLLFCTGQVQVSKNCFVRVKNGRLDFPKYEFQNKGFEIPFEQNSIKIPSGTINVRKINDFMAKSIQKINKDILDNGVDYAKIDKHCVFRSRKDGDKFSPKGR
ncbi:MAG: tRNA lysidine(34) synthetase TilS, partial [Oscillospiraceae bacterium]